MRDLLLRVAILLRARARESSECAEQSRHEDLLPVALDHAWKWFSLHATQRLQVINFFLVTAGFLAASYVRALTDGSLGLALALAAVGALLTVGYWRLEGRNNQIVKIAEDALRPLEHRLGQAIDIPEIELARRAHKAPRLSSYGFVFRFVLRLVFTCFVGALAYASWLIADDVSAEPEPAPSVTPRSSEAS